MVRAYGASSAKVLRPIPFCCGSMNRHIEYARNHLQRARSELMTYLEAEIDKAGSDYELAKKTGIPRSTIRAAISRGSVTGLFKLAEKIAKVKQ